MAAKKQSLTNEILSRVFNDNFKLTNCVIHLAQNRIHGGDDELNVTSLLDEVKKQPELIDQPEEEMQETL